MSGDVLTTKPQEAKNAKHVSNNHVSMEPKTSKAGESTGRAPSLPPAARHTRRSPGAQLIAGVGLRSNRRVFLRIVRANENGVVGEIVLDTKRRSKQTEGGRHSLGQGSLKDLHFASGFLVLEAWFWDCDFLYYGLGLRPLGNDPI